MEPRELLKTPSHFGAVSGTKLRDDLAAVVPSVRLGEVAAAVWQHHFSIALRQTMRVRELTQREVAELAGVSEDVLNHILNGRRVASQSFLFEIVLALEAIDLLPRPLESPDLLKP